MSAVFGMWGPYWGLPQFVSFDPFNLVINEVNTGLPENELNAIDIYSEWKEWLRIYDDMKYYQAFSVIGGEPITATERIGATFFLENGWRIRPAEYDHKLTIVGNIYTREPGESVYLPTLGDYTVNTETRVSALSIANIAEADAATLTSILASVLSTDTVIQAMAPKVDDIHRLLGLNVNETLTIIPSVPGGTAGSQTLSDSGIVLQVAEAIDGTITVTRTA